MYICIMHTQLHTLQINSWMHSGCQRLCPVVKQLTLKLVIREKTEIKYHEELMEIFMISDSTKFLSVLKIICGHRLAFNWSEVCMYVCMYVCTYTVCYVSTFLYIYVAIL